MYQTAPAYDKDHLLTRSSPRQFSWQHILFWIIVTIIFLIDRRYLIEKAGLPHFLICSLIRITLLIAIAYINLYVLIPRFLIPKKYGRYASCVITLVVGYVLVQGLYDYFLFKAILAPIKHKPEMGFILYNLMSTFFYLVVTVALRFGLDWYQQKQQLQKVELEKLQAEVKYLRAQVNPHFLFNILNNLYSLTLKKSDAAPGMVLKLSEMMEYMLYDTDKNFVELDKEIQYLRNYIDFEKLRKGNHATIEFNVTGNPHDLKIAPFIFLPLIENAFKHGISKIINNAYLHAHLIIEHHEIWFKLENNKLNFLPTDEYSGIGLSNLKQRLSLIYPDRHTLSVADNQNIYKTELHLRLD